MWVGQQLADGLDFWGFLGSLILGGIILGIYTGPPTTKPQVTKS